MEDSRNPSLTFVLSAGRTGTVFLAQVLAQRFPEALVLHEPSPARYELLLANMRNDLGLGGSLLRWLFMAARRRRLARCAGGRVYVEINPHLCPLVDLLPELAIPFNVIHLIREPGSWARSITTFRASKPFRSVIDLIPFAKPYPTPRPAAWSRLNEFERALWRWRFCNERIAALKPRCQSYTLLRFEDMFASDPTRRRETLNRFLESLPMPLPDDLSNFESAAPANAAPDRADLGEAALDRVAPICGELMARWGYGA